MSVWYCIPSARPPAEAEKCLSKWRERGYKIALWRDNDPRLPGVDLTIIAPYIGYARAVNELVRLVLAEDLTCDWVVTGGDDTYPEPHKKADEIAQELTAFFGGTFGVCQPTGDDWSDYMGRIIERIAGSPWIGRDFAQRINGGRGPYWPEYRHNWCDQEIMEVAQRLGVFLQRRDLCHYHDHSVRKPGGKWLDFQLWFSQDYKDKKPLFDERRAGGFPGHDPV